MITAIVATAYIEHLMGSLLAGFLIDGRTSESLLSPTSTTLQTKAKWGYALGLVSKGCLDKITKIGDIRNKFAHGIDDSNFDTPAIKSIILSIPKPKGDLMSGIVSESLEETIQLIESDNPRARFVYSANSMAAYLTIVTHIVEKREKSEDYMDDSFRFPNANLNDTKPDDVN